MARVRPVVYDGAVTTHDPTLALGTVQWGMAYGIAKTISKDPDSFGKGNVDGVVG